MKQVLKLVAEILVRVVLALHGLANRRHPAPALPVNPQEVQRILVIRLDLLGDAVFSLPAVQAMVEAFPAAQVDLLVLPYAAPLLRATPGVRRVIELDINAYRAAKGMRQIRTLIRTIRWLRAERYDLAFSLSRWMGGLFAAMSGARLRAGPAAETYWGCYNLPLRGRRYASGQHEVDLCLNLVEQVVGAGSPPERTPALVAPRLSGGRPAVASPYIVALPGASNGSAKRWPGQYWGELATLLGEAGLNVVFCGAAADRALVTGLPEDDHVVNLIGGTSVDELADVLAGSVAVVAGDTGPLHVAAALGRPVIGIYGPTDPVNTGPRGREVRVLRAGLPCSPCYDLRGPAECKLPDRSVACMWSIKPPAVASAVCALLGRELVTADE